MQISFTVLGKPMGKERARMFYDFKKGKNRVYTPEKTKFYEASIRTNYMRVIRHKFERGMALEANIIAFYELPENINDEIKKAMLNGDILPTCKPNCDNVIKIVLDSLNKTAFHDDAQVSRINFEKRYAAIPKVVVKIRNIESEAQKIGTVCNNRASFRI